MRVIIGGAGEVGRGLGRALRAEGRDVVLIDTDSTAVREAQTLDALVLRGDIIDRRMLGEAGITEASVFIAATSSDERNLLACSLAKHAWENTEASRKGHDLTTIARVSNPFLVREMDDGHLDAWTAVDFAVSPDEAAIERLVLGLREASLLEIIPFGEQAYIVEIEITREAHELVHRSLAEVGQRIDGLPLIVALFRPGEVPRVPTATTQLVPGDHIAVATIGNHGFRRIGRLTGHDPIEFPDQPRVAVFGAGSQGRKVAERYMSMGCRVTVIEQSLSAANALAGSSLGSEPLLEVVHGDPHDRELLTEIEIERHDVAVATLGDDLRNIASSLIATELGVRRTGLILEDSDLVPLVRRMGLTFGVNRRKVAIESILGSVHQELPGAFGLLGHGRELAGLSVRLREGSIHEGQTLAHIALPDECRVAFVQRTGLDGSTSTLQGRADLTLHAGDSLLVFLPVSQLAATEMLLEQ